MGFVLLAIVALILFGTLYPFGFSCPATFDAALGQFKPLIRQISRGDLAANLVLFIPFGLAAMAWARRIPVVLRLVLVVFAGFALSASIELAQACVPGRTSSWSDVALNTASAATGAILLPLFQRLIGRRRPEAGQADVSAALLLGAFLVWQLAPFVPTIDWQKWRNALKPLLLNPDLSPATILSYLVVWLLVARLSLAVFRPRRPLLLWIALLAATQAAELIVVGKVLRAGELLGAAIGIALAPLVLNPLRKRSGDRLLIMLLVAYIAYVGLEPFTFGGPPRSFNWLPFSGFLHGSMFVAVQAAGQKLFSFGTLIWLIARCGLPLWPATVMVTIAISGIEWIQTYLPGRVPEITDPLLVLMAGIIARLLDRRTDRTPALTARTRGPH